MTIHQNLMGLINKQRTKLVKGKKAIITDGISTTKLIHKAKVLSYADVQANRSTAYSFLSL